MRELNHPACTISVQMSDVQHASDTLFMRGSRNVDIIDAGLRYYDPEIRRSTRMDACHETSPAAIRRHGHGSAIAISRRTGRVGMEEVARRCHWWHCFGGLVVGGSGRGLVEMGFIPDSAAAPGHQV